MFITKSKHNKIVSDYENEIKYLKEELAQNKNLKSILP